MVGSVEVRTVYAIHKPTCECCQVDISRFYPKDKEIYMSIVDETDDIVDSKHTVHMMAIARITRIVRRMTWDSPGSNDVRLLVRIDAIKDKSRTNLGTCEVSHFTNVASHVPTISLMASEITDVTARTGEDNHVGSEFLIFQIGV
jgi:hypothetical protein